MFEQLTYYSISVDFLIVFTISIHFMHTKNSISKSKHERYDIKLEKVTVLDTKKNTNNLKCTQQRTQNANASMYGRVIEIDSASL